MQASLQVYNEKRNFRKTSEPKGHLHKNLDRKIFVIQRHEATRLHYDFRLELGGVLKSWAIPKEPVLDPSVKRLAVQTEDHPIEYATFRGDIPKGQYGGGHVEIWDAGEWIPLDEDPSAAFDEGRLNFEIRGKKLKGRWTLIRTKGLGHSKKDQNKNWLLIKNRDEWSEKQASAKPSNTRQISGKATRKKTTSMAEPQLAVLVDRPPKGPNWVFEEKYDGYRIMAQIQNSKIHLLSRYGNDWTKRFQVIQKSLAKLGLRDVIFDGELVAIGPQGHSDFQLLQNSLVDRKKQSNLVYHVFDLLQYEGENLESRPLTERRKLLEKILANQKDRHLQLSQILKGKDANQVWKQACASGWEGIICKRQDRPYQHWRSPDWLKVKCKMGQEFVIIGFTEPQGAREHFGALLLASRDAETKGKLQYVGKVGTGFTKTTLKELFGQLKKLEVRKPALQASDVREKQVHWIQPDLIAQIEFHGWTQDRILRQPSFKGLREDKPAAEVKIEKAKPVEEVARTKSEESKVVLTHPDRVLFPEAEVTKADLAEYFESVCDLAFPLIKDHPLALIRCPSGIDKACFFQQQAKSTLATQPGLQAVTTGDSESRLEITGPSGFQSLVQNGAIELHMWGASNQNLEKPDQVVFDLDPDPALPWSQVIKAVRQLINFIEEDGLVPFLKLTGGKGVHVHAPIRPNSSWDRVHAYAEKVAKDLEASGLKVFTTTSLKKERKGLIYIDYLRNSRGVTFVAPYSPRAKPSAPVATPIFPDELSAKIKPDSLTVRNMAKRIHRQKQDPWADFKKSAVELPSR